MTFGGIDIAEHRAATTAEGALTDWFLLADRVVASGMVALAPFAHVFSSVLVLGS
jgi:hypothetical protein